MMVTVAFGTVSPSEYRTVDETYTLCDSWMLGRKRPQNARRPERDCTADPVNDFQKASTGLRLEVSSSVIILSMKTIS